MSDPKKPFSVVDSVMGSGGVGKGGKTRSYAIDDEVNKIVNGGPTAVAKAVPTAGLADAKAKVLKAPYVPTAAETSAKTYGSPIDTPLVTPTS